MMHNSAEAGSTDDDIRSLQDGRIVHRDFDKYDELPVVAAAPSTEFDDMTLVTLADGTCFPLVTEDIEISQ